MFKPGQSGNPNGRAKGVQTAKTRIENLLGAPAIDKALADDFFAGNVDVRKFVYEHFYGKPVQENKNTNTNSFSDGWELSFTKPKTAENK
jgi:hypothetical protein